MIVEEKKQAIVISLKNSVRNKLSHTEFKFSEVKNIFDLKIIDLFNNFHLRWTILIYQFHDIKTFFIFREI